MAYKTLDETAGCMCRYLAGQPSGKLFSTCDLYALSGCEGKIDDSSSYFHYLSELDRLFWKKVVNEKISNPDFDEYRGYSGEIPALGLPSCNIPYRCWKPGDGIRKARITDLDEITALEALCFPPTEAADQLSFGWRLKVCKKHFLVLCMHGRIISFVNGPVTRNADLTDSMYNDPSCHDENGEWQMIFGLVTRPDFQNRGYASYLLKNFLRDAGTSGRKGVVLTCKEHRIPFYRTFGFLDEGLSSSTHGGVPWHQMRLVF